MDASLQPPAKRPRQGEASGVVAFPGDVGALAHVAANRIFGGAADFELKGVRSFASVFEMVMDGTAAYGIVPIENSASGTLHCTYDLLVQHDVSICAEVGVREVYCLCARQACALKDISRVLSHPNILEACSGFIESQLPRASALETVATQSTTDAAQRVAACSAPLDLDLDGQVEAPAPAPAPAPAAPAEPPGAASASASVSAAIATAEAAAHHGLVILARDIGNDTLLETRYIVLCCRRGLAPGAAATESQSLEGGGGHRLPCLQRPQRSQNNSSGLEAAVPEAAQARPRQKRSACFALSNEPGAAFKLLSCWALRGIDVLKLETRPLAAGHRSPAGVPAGLACLWEYLFYVDFAVPQGFTPEASQRLWDALREFSIWQRDLGTYPSIVTHGTKHARSWTEMVDLMAKS